MKKHSKSKCYYSPHPSLTQQLSCLPPLLDENPKWNTVLGAWTTRCMHGHQTHLSSFPSWGCVLSWQGSGHQCLLWWKIFAVVFLPLDLIFYLLQYGSDNNCRAVLIIAWLLYILLDPNGHPIQKFADGAIKIPTNFGIPQHLPLAHNGAHKDLQ